MLTFKIYNTFLTNIHCNKSSKRITYISKLNILHKLNILLCYHLYCTSKQNKHHFSKHEKKMHAHTGHTILGLKKNKNKKQKKEHKKNIKIKLERLDLHLHLVEQKRALAWKYGSPFLLTPPSTSSQSCCGTYSVWGSVNLRFAAWGSIGSFLVTVVGSSGSHVSSQQGEASKPAFSLSLSLPHLMLSLGSFSQASMD